MGEPALPDDLLIAQIAEGDREAFAELYRRHHADVCRFAAHMCGSNAAAEDIVHEAFVAVIDSARRYRPGRTTVKLWLLGIARNYARRARAVRPTLSLHDEAQTGAAELAFEVDPVGDLDRRRHLEARATQFVQILTRDLQAVSGDKHLVVEFSAEPIEAGAASPPPDTAANLPPANGRGLATSRGPDCRFVNVAVLAGNVGYIKFDAFVSPNTCGETAAAAMSLVAGCDSLIFDLRDNLGGNPAMVAFISSYLFQEPVHLDDIFERRTNVSVESWTLPYVPGRKFIGSPVFVLTSPRTFSGAEEFAYNLQMLKRAVIVGEASGGGAHPAVPLRIGAHFQVVVPVARYINPVSRTNWEGRGVEPDIRAREDVAVQAAYRAALEGVIQTMTPSKQRDAVGRQIDALTKVIGATSSSR